MKIELIVVGKTTDKNLDILIGEYTNRLKHYVNFSLTIQSELKNTKGLTPEQQKEIEGEELIHRFKDSDYVILLDEHGEEYRSVDFAKYIEKSSITSQRSSIVFVIGGPYGFAKKVYNRANHKISLSKMTFSHQMIRLLFVEQLYRAYTIINNQPYHHE